MNTKSKMLKWVLACALIICLCVPLLAACGDKSNKVTLKVLATEGGAITSPNEVNKNSDVTVTATPKEYYEFLGWVEASTVNEVLMEPDVTFVSELPSYTFKITKDTTLVALFKGSPIKSIDRILSGANYKYNDFQTTGQNKKFAFDASVYLNVKFNKLNKDERIRLDATGNINLLGTDSQVKLSLFDELNNNSIFELYYKDTAISGKAELYLSFGETKQQIDFLTIADFVNMFTPTTLSTQQANLANENQIWNIAEIIKNLVGPTGDSESIIDLLTQLLGPENSFGFFGNIVNTETSTKIDIYVNSILIWAKTFMESLGSAIPQNVKDIINSLTSEYPLSNYPIIKLSLEAGYSKIGEIEYLSSFKANLFTNNDYLLSNGEIPALTFDIGVNKLDFKFVNEEFTNINFNTDGFVYANHKLINISSVGKIKASNVEESGTTLNNTYTASVYADIDPLAIIPAISKTGFDYTKINWSNLGMFNFKIVNDESGLEYINILLDKVNDRPTLFVRLNLINNLQVVVSVPVQINTNYDVIDLIEYIKNPYTTKVAATQNIVSKSNMVTANTAASFNPTIIAPIVKLIPDLIGLITNNVDLGEVIVTIAKEFASLINTTAPNSLGIDMSLLKEALQNDLTYSAATGLSINLTKIKQVLNLNVGSMNVNLSNAMFGTTNKLEINLETPVYGGTKTITENGKSYYLDNNNNKLIDLWNSYDNNNGKVITKINSIPKIENQKFLIGYDLEQAFPAGERIETNVTFSDGTTGTYSMSIVKVDYNETLTTAGTKTAKLYLRYCGSPLVESALWSYVKLPIGIFSKDVTFEVVNNAPAEDLIWEINNIVKDENDVEYYINYAGTDYVTQKVAYTKIQHTAESGEKVYTIKEDVSITTADGTNFVDSNNKFVVGEFDVTLSGFGTTKTIKMINYEVNNIPTNLDFNSSTNHYQTLSDNVQISSSTNVYGVGGLLVKAVNSSNQSISEDLSTSKTNLSDEFIKFLVDNNITEVKVTYYPLINNILVASYTIINTSDKLVGITLPEQSVETVTYYGERQTVTEIGTDMIFKLELSSDGNGKLIYAMLAGNTIDWSSPVEFTYTISQNTLTTSNEAIRGTINGDVITLVFGSFGFDVTTTLTNYSKTVISNNSKMAGTDVKLQLNNDGSYVIGVDGGESLNVLSSGTYTFDPLNKVFTFTVVTGATPKTVNVTLTNNIITLDLVQLIDPMYVEYFSNVNSAEFTI